MDKGSGGEEGVGEDGPVPPGRWSGPAPAVGSGHANSHWCQQWTEGTKDDGL